MVVLDSRPLVKRGFHFKCLVSRMHSVNFKTFKREVPTGVCVSFHGCCKPDWKLIRMEKIELAMLVSAAATHSTFPKKNVIRSNMCTGVS